MKQNKMILLILVFVMTAVMGIGCSDKKEPDNVIVATTPSDTAARTEADDTTAEVTEATDDEDDDETESAETEEIRENGKLPEDIDDFNPAEIAYYGELFVNAIKTLDIDVLAEYLDSEYDLEKLQSIKENQEEYDFWVKILGDMIYFAEDDIYLTKNIAYVFAAWYTDNLNKVEFPDEVADISNEEAMTIYEQYYLDAPYSGHSDFMDDCDAYVEDGYLKFDLDDVADELFDGFNFSDVYNVGYGRPNGLRFAVMLMGDNTFYDSSLDSLKEDFPDYQLFMDKDWDAIVELPKGLDKSEKEGFYWEYYEKYYLDEANYAIIKAYLEENATVFMDNLGIMVFTPVSYEASYPVHYLSDKNKEKIKDLNVMDGKRLYEYPTDFGNSFSVFYDTIDKLKKEGVLK